MSSRTRACGQSARLGGYDMASGDGNPGTGGTVGNMKALNVTWRTPRTTQAPTASPRGTVGRARAPSAATTAAAERDGNEERRFLLPIRVTNRKGVSAASQRSARGSPQRRT